jgi:hypothetical protein
LLPLITALLGIAGTLFVQWLIVYWERKEKATYLAILLVQSLQRYVSYCRSAVADHIDKNTHGCRGQLIEEIPHMFKLPESNDYFKLNKKIFAQLLDFDSECEDRQNYIVGAPFLAPDEQDGLFLTATCEMGIRADDLAENLRKKYKLPCSQYREQTRAFLDEKLKNKK